MTIVISNESSDLDNPNFLEKKALISKILTRMNAVAILAEKKNTKASANTFFDLVFMSNQQLKALAKKIEA